MSVAWTGDIHIAATALAKRNSAAAKNRIESDIFLWCNVQLRETLDTWDQLFTLLQVQIEYGAHR